MKTALNIALALLLSRRARDIVRIHVRNFVRRNLWWREDGVGTFISWAGLAISLVPPALCLIWLLHAMTAVPRDREILCFQRWHDQTGNGNDATVDCDAPAGTFPWPQDGQGRFALTINGVPQPVSRGDCVYAGSDGLWRAGACTGR